MKNPAVFVNLDETDGLSDMISRIQANEGGFNLSRVNVYAVARGDANAGAGRKIRTAFCAEFVGVDITLVVPIMRETGGTARELLRTLTRESNAPFDRIFILSDKNEHGEILPGADEHICKIIAALPLLHNTNSRFNELLTARCAGQIPLASAGFWQKPPPQFVENRELHRLASVLEAQFSGALPPNPHEGTQSPRPLIEKPQRARFFGGRISGGSEGETSRIAKDIVSVVAKPLRFWELRGCSIKEAEILLFADHAEKFFEKNFPPENPAPENYAKLPLREAAATERALKETLLETDMAVRILENETARAAEYVIRPWESVERVKEKIGEYYALRAELQSLRTTHTKYTTEHSALSAALNETRATITRIKNLPTSEPPHNLTDPQILSRAERLAPISLPLLRDDSLLRENHIIRNEQNESSLLRVIGGFALRDIQ